MELFNSFVIKIVIVVLFVGNSFRNIIEVVDNNSGCGYISVKNWCLLWYFLVFLVFLV